MVIVSIEAASHTETFSFSCDLPDDVFGPGEVKPSRPQKKKMANGVSKKRSAPDVRSPYLVSAMELLLRVDLGTKYKLPRRTCGRTLTSIRITLLRLHRSDNRHR